MPAVATQPVTYGKDASLARFSVARYQKMIETGILDTNDKVELLEGYVVLKMSRNDEHDGGIHVVDELIRSKLPPGWTARIQLSLKLSDSQPEPDVLLARGTARTYARRRPIASDVGLIIEVANTSLQRDTEDKPRIYARACIPIYWVIDVTNGHIIVHAQPSGPADAPAYADVRTIQPPDVVPLVLDGVTVATIPASELLP